jgi:hypothetical protein
VFTFKTIPIALLCLVSIYANAQVNIVGQVFDNSTQQVLVAVSIYNAQQQQSTLSQTDGSFTLNAQKGNWIVFRYVGYKTDSVQVPHSIGKWPLKVFLQPTSYNLPLMQATAKTIDFKRDSIESHKLYKFVFNKNKESLYSPISFFYTRFNKDFKRQIALRNQMVSDETRNYVLTKISRSRLQQKTQITDEEWNSFVMWYSPTEEFARHATEYELYQDVLYNIMYWKQKQ